MMSGNDERRPSSPGRTAPNQYLPHHYSTSRTIPKPEGWPAAPRLTAFHGLAGDFVSAIEPHSEADPAGMLVSFLAAYGNVVGRGSWFCVEADRHHPNLFVTLVGSSSKGRKGTSWGHIRRLFERVAGPWSKECIASGLSTGEGLAWRVRDPTSDKDQGTADKRLLVIEPELASVLRRMRRDGNTLSSTLRDAWDSGFLRVMTKNSPVAATDAHISVVAHITTEELRRELSDTDAANGFGNRFLWSMVRRCRILPEGGQPDLNQLEDIETRLRDAVDFGQNAGELRRDDEARAYWADIYAQLSAGKPGQFGAVTGRAEAQVTRLSLIFALLDLAPQIGIDHIMAGHALWHYCEASARTIFGTGTGNSYADTILELLRENSHGLTRTEIRDAFGKHHSGRVRTALQLLLELGLATKEKHRGTGGRAAERWRLVEGEEG